MSNERMTIGEIKERVDMRAFLSSVSSVLGQWKETQTDRWEGIQHKSLVIDPAKRRIHWNGQSWHGDIFDFLKDWCGLDDKGAIEYLKGLAGLAGGVVIDTASLAAAPVDVGPKRPNGNPPSEGVVAHLNSQLLANPAALAWIAKRYSLTADDVEFYRLGYVDNLWGREGPGIFFPVYFRDAIVTGRVRLMTDGDGSRYRPWAQGCGGWAWGLDVAAQSNVVAVWEGEFKAMTGNKWGQVVVGLPGVDSFMPSVTPADYPTREAFEKAYWDIFRGKRVYIALDPGQDGLWRMIRDISTKAIISMAKREWVWKLIDIADVWIIDLPGMKPDDLINRVGIDAYLACVNAAQPARFLAGTVRPCGVRREH